MAVAVRGDLFCDLSSMGLIPGKYRLIRDAALFQQRLQFLPHVFSKPGSGSRIDNKMIHGRVPSFYSLKKPVQIYFQRAGHITFKIGFSVLQTPFEYIADHDHADIRGHVL